MLLNFKIYYNELTDDEKYIRETVFVKEQGFKEEFDSIDNFSTHILVYGHNNKAIGCGRFYFDKEKNCFIIGRVAILKEYRKQGVGKFLIEKLIEEIKKKDAKVVYLSSQKRAVDFYENCGFKCEGDFFLEENYPHILMYKNLN